MDLRGKRLTLALAAVGALGVLGVLWWLARRRAATVPQLPPRAG